ncbi:hypothetical protein H2204_000684 [Knufia peltigerae]|uniref:Uncharacterized protein n=1 Tax=Knufia peltigerae TaxID=1002370 RepID=A0AA39D3W7_9EURO|nr:hypothetical protein H2204_000684 [Knufia peltigerae]
MSVVGISGLRSIGVSDLLASLAVDEPQSDDGAADPDDGRQEAKRLVGFPPSAISSVSNAAPVERVTAAVRPTVDVVHQDAESGEPSKREEKVDRPVEEASRERQQPQKAEEDGKRGDYLDVDEATERLAGAATVVVQVL